MCRSMIKNLSEIGYLPISVCPEDLENRIGIVFSFEDSHSAREVSEALSDVIGYQSYAGEVPVCSQSKLCTWILQHYDQTDTELVDSISSILCMCSTLEALNTLKTLISMTTEPQASCLLLEGLSEFELAT